MSKDGHCFLDVVTAITVSGSKSHIENEHKKWVLKSFTNILISMLSSNETTTLCYSLCLLEIGNLDKKTYVNVNYQTKQAIQRCAYFRTFSAHVYLGK